MKKFYGIKQMIEDREKIKSPPLTEEDAIRLLNNQYKEDV